MAESGTEKSLPSADKLLDHAKSFWESQVLKTFQDFITIHCISPAYSTDALKQLTAARELVMGWIQKQDLNATFELGHATKDGKSDGKEPYPPVLLVTIPGTVKGSVVSYGHIDKQAVIGGYDPNSKPAINKWTQPPNAIKRGPYDPNIYEDYLYGRGTSDDGFATFTMITAIATLKKCSVDYPTIHMIIDSAEESGSPNLEHSIKHFKKKIGEPQLAFELDSSIGDYERLWHGTSARGTITGSLQVKVLDVAVHSGDGGGVVPNPVNIMRILLDRIQDPRTGEVIINEFKVPISAVSVADAQAEAANLGYHMLGDFPWFKNAAPILQDPTQSNLNKTWRAALAITGQSGLPSLEQASNVIIPALTYQLSMRVPPSLNVDEAQSILKNKLEADPPFGAEVIYNYVGAPIGAGWVAPVRDPWFKEATQLASRAVFSKDAAASSDGGTIPVLNLLSKYFPKSQILASGCAGPDNNEHAANENLNMDYAQKFAVCLAMLIHAAGVQASKSSRFANSTIFARRIFK